MEKNKFPNGLPIDPNKPIPVCVNDGKTGDPKDINYIPIKPVGNGSFGVVYQAKIIETSELVAIKRVLQDKRYKNRELDIMRLISHPNVVQLNCFFYSKGEKKDEVYLNLVLEFVPETIYRASRHFAKLRQTMPILQIKLYIYQLLRSLAYTHFLGICHRDIKPQNLLLDPFTNILKLCDFGSAKVLVAGEPNVSYICSRYYRAPELIFGATNYTTAIDLWSTGCVMAELMLGQPLFPGESAVDQLVEIIKVLGTPTRQQILAMNPNYNEFMFPQIKASPWTKVFKSKTIPPEALDLLSKMLEYVPQTRIDPIGALVHPFFDELRDPATKIMGKDLPLLFNFTEQELSLKPELNRLLIPSHAEAELQKRLNLSSFLNNSASSSRTPQNAMES